MTEPCSGQGEPPEPPSGSSNRPRSHRQHTPAPGRSTASQDDHDAELADLLRRSGHGDETAFAALYDLTASRVYGVTLRVTRSPQIAAEVLQEVYLMAWQQASRFDPARGSVPGWLCTLAHRRAVDRIRQVARERDREQTYEDRRSGTPADETWQEVEQTMDTQQLRASMDVLTPLQREAVTLVYYGGCTHQEVAQRLGIPLGTAKARIRGGLDRLRAAWGSRS